MMASCVKTQINILYDDDDDIKNVTVLELYPLKIYNGFWVIGP